MAADGALGVVKLNAGLGTALTFVHALCCRNCRQSSESNACRLIDAWSDHVVWSIVARFTCARCIDAQHENPTIMRTKFRKKEQAAQCLRPTWQVV